MRVMTICKMNQARSPFAQAVIAKQFPDLKIISAGVQAITGAAYLAEVVGIARRWGVNLANGFSSALDEVEDLLEFNLVICAEEAMLGDHALLGFKGTTVSYEQYVPDPSFMPRDPAGLSGRSLESELAKVALVNIWAVRNFLNMKPLNSIIAVVPETESAVSAAIDWAIAESERIGAQLVDGDLRAPLFAEFRKRELQVGNFSQINTGVNFDVYSSVTEQSNPEKLFLDYWWHESISKISSVRPVVLVTAPQFLNTGPLPDPYLAAIIAHQIKVIRH